MRTFHEDMKQVPFQALTLFQRHFDYHLPLDHEVTCQAGDVIYFHETMEHIHIDVDHNGFRIPKREYRRTGKSHIAIITSVEAIPKVHHSRYDNDRSISFVTCEPAPAIFKSFLTCNAQTKQRILQSVDDAFIYVHTFVQYEEAERVWLQSYIRTYMTHHS